MIAFAKHRWVFVLVVGFLFGISVATQVLLQKTRASVRSDVSVYGDRLQSALMEFDEAVGCGGFIHNFKNAVLRPDEARYPADAERNYFEALTYLDELALLAELAGIKIDMSVARATLGEYMRQLARIDALHASGATIDAVDQAVRVSDALAVPKIRSIGDTLREEYRSR